MRKKQSKGIKTFPTLFFGGAVAGQEPVMFAQHEPRADALTCQRMRDFIEDWNESQFEDAPSTRRLFFPSDFRPAFFGSEKGGAVNLGSVFPSDASIVFVGVAFPNAIFAWRASAENCASFYGEPFDAVWAWTANLAFMLYGDTACAKVRDAMRDAVKNRKAA